MSTKSIITVLLTIVSFPSISQISYQTLDHNNAKTTLSTSGTQFHDFDTGVDGYLVPKNGGIAQLSGLRFLYAGQDVNGQLHAALGGNDIGTDVFPGNYGTTPNQEYALYELSQEELYQYDLYVRMTHDPNSVSEEEAATYHGFSNETLSIIYSWPPCFPFVDRNGNGVYDPEFMDGDYPKMKGCKAYYLVQNDNANTHTYSGSQPLGIETHYLFYQFATFDYLNDITFVDVCTINKSVYSYFDYKQSLFFSQENSVDETLFGCDSTKQLGYIYSAEDSENAQALGVLNLNGNTSSMQPLPFTSSLSENWMNMSGLKANGTSWTTPSGNTSNFAFHGNPNDQTSWNQLTNGDGNGYDHFLLNSEIGTLSPNQSVSGNYAIIYAKGNSNVESVTKLLQLTDSVNAFYVSGVYEECTNGYLANSELQFNEEQLQIFPNPTTGISTISGLEGTASEFRLFDLNGKQITHGTLNDLIDLSTIESGFYMLQIQTKNGLINKRIVKN